MPLGRSRCPGLRWGRFLLPDLPLHPGGGTQGDGDPPQRLANATARPPREVAPGRWEQNQQAPGQVARTDGPAAPHGGGGGPRRPARAQALWPTQLLPCSGRCVAGQACPVLAPGREHAAFAVCSPLFRFRPACRRASRAPLSRCSHSPAVRVLHTSAPSPRVAETDLRDVKPLAQGHTAPRGASASAAGLSCLLGTHLGPWLALPTFEEQNGCQGKNSKINQGPKM